MAKKEETKEIKKTQATKTTKKDETKNNKKKDSKKKPSKVKKENYFAGVKSEMSKVKWPTKKEVLKYTVSTIVFVLILVVFFILMSLIMSGIKGAFN